MGCRTKMPDQQANDKTDNTFDSAYLHPILNEILDALVSNRFYSDIKVNREEEIDGQKLSKAAWLASVLSMSENYKHQKKALAFAVLAYLARPEDVRFSRLCYVIISSLGIIPLSEHMIEFKDEKRPEMIRDEFESLLSMELEFENDVSKLNVGDMVIYTSDYEREIWNIATEKQYIAISGPTSSGKSFMIQNFLINKFRQESEYRCIYIVPTKALIYEVTTKMRTRLKGHNVTIRNALTSAKEQKFNTKELLVLTPERCLKLFEKANEEFVPNVVFFDEIQKLEDGERGVLFEYILNNLATSWNGTKFIIAGPYLDKVEKTFRELSGFDSDLVKTKFSSVFQIVATLQYHKNTKGFSAIIKSPSEKDLKINMESNASLYNKIKHDAGNAISYIINEYFRDAYNLVYSSGKKNAESWAVKIAEKRSSYEERIDNERIDGLIDYLSEEIHPDYSLIKCLKHGVAFHHGSMPDIARLEVEDLYRDGTIKNVVCTTTLLEGVNLPAENIIILTNKKGRDKQGKSNYLEIFEFGNLIGRAGRLDSHIYGSVYCVEVDDNKWAEKNLVDPSKEIVPVTTNALTKMKEELLNSLEKLPNQITNSTIEYTICLLRNKFLRDEQKLIDYLKIKGLSAIEIKMVFDAFNKTLLNLSIPKELLALNPTIDPLLQERLYATIKREGISTWLISGNVYSQEHNIETERDIPFEERSFYGKFESVAERLDQIFNICKPQDFVYEKDGHDRRPTIRQVVRYAVPWLRGMPYKSLIEMDLKDKALNAKEVDKAIRNVIFKVDEYVRFEFVKYFKVWSDILKYVIKAESLEEGPYLSLPQMLEFGAVKPRALELMAEGINRSVAVKIAERIPNNFDGKATNWIESNPNLGFKPLFLKHLRSQGFNVN